MFLRMKPNLSNKNILNEKTKNIDKKMIIITNIIIVKKKRKFIIMNNLK